MSGYPTEASSSTRRKVTKFNVPTALTDLFHEISVGAVRVSELDGTSTILVGADSTGYLIDATTTSPTLAGLTLTGLAGTATRLAQWTSTGVADDLANGTANQIVGMNSGATSQEYKAMTVTSAGVVTAGTWNGTAIGVGYGGTGLTAVGTANQLFGTNAGATGFEHKAVTATAAGAVAGVTTLTASGNITSTGGSFFVSDTCGVISTISGSDRKMITRQSLALQVGDNAGGWTSANYMISSGTHTFYYGATNIVNFGSGAINLNDATVVTGTFRATLAATLNNTLTVNAAGTFDTTLTVTGRGVFGGALNISHLLFVTGGSSGTSQLQGTSQNGLVVDVTVTDAATGTARGGYFKVSTAAAAFINSVMNVIEAAVPTVGAGSTITDLRGVVINGMTGATNNYGLFIEAISGGTINRAIHTAGGTHVLVGNVRIGAGTEPTVALDITGAAKISSTLGVTGGVGVGGEYDASAALYLRGTAGIATGVAQRGILSSFKSGTDATTAVTGISISNSGANGSYTTTTVRGVDIGDYTKGTSQTVTTLVGFSIRDQTAGATNWSMQIGSAQSYHAGNLRIGSTSAPTVALDVTGAALISSTLGVTGVTTLTNLSGSSSSLVLASSVGVLSASIIGFSSGIFTQSFATAGTATAFNVQHTDNTNASSNSRVGAVVGGSSGGDPLFLLSISGTRQWSMGIDNSDSDKYKIGWNTAVGTDTVLTLATDNSATFAGAVTSTGAINTDSTTDATSTTTGSLQTDGGLGVVKKAYFGDLVVTAASTTTNAGLRIPSGTAPSSPTSGDIWYDGTNLKFRDGGTTRTLTWV